MRNPISISRTSLVLLAVVTASADRVPSDAAPRTLPIKPSATALVRLNAPIYGIRMQDSAAVLQSVRDTLLMLLDSAYRYVDWVSNASAGTRDTVAVEVFHDVNSFNDVLLKITLTGAHASGDTLTATFEPHADVLSRADWATPGVVTHWAQRLREVNRRTGVALVHKVLVHLPLAVQPQLRQIEATIPIGPDDIDAADSPSPEFRLLVNIIDTGPPATEDPADLYLTRCRSGPAAYACRAQMAVFLGDTLRDQDLVRELTGATRLIQPISVHLWRYSPRTDPRSDEGLLAPGGTP